MNYEKTLSFYYGDAVKMKISLSASLQRFEAVTNKTPKVIQRITDLKKIINAA